jgi:hypothetical protein
MIMAYFEINQHRGGYCWAFNGDESCTQVRPDDVWDTVEECVKDLKKFREEVANTTSVTVVEGEVSLVETEKETEQG